MFRKRPIPANNRENAQNPQTSAYVAALQMLSRRELSEKQVRERLTRGGYELPEVAEALERLKAERAVDDERVAHAIARSQTSIRRRGPLRVKREIEQAGIRGETARAAVEATFDELSAAELLVSVLDRKLKGRSTVADERQFRRLYRYLVTQGFESGQVLQALRARGYSAEE